MSLEKTMPKEFVTYLSPEDEPNITYKAYIIPKRISDGSLYGFIGIQKIEEKAKIPFLRKIRGNYTTKKIKRVIFDILVGDTELEDGYDFVVFPKTNPKKAYSCLIETAEREGIKFSEKSLDKLFAPIMEKLRIFYSD